MVANRGNRPVGTPPLPVGHRLPPKANHTALTFPLPPDRTANERMVKQKQAWCCSISPAKKSFQENQEGRTNSMWPWDKIPYPQTSQAPLWVLKWVVNSPTLSLGSQNGFDHHTVASTNEAFGLALDGLQDHRLGAGQTGLGRLRRLLNQLLGRLRLHAAGSWWAMYLLGVCPKLC